MRPGLLLGLTLLAVGSSASAQSLPEYLKLRRTYGIRRAAAPEALTAFVGKRILEVSGIVKGTFAVGERLTLLLESGDPDEPLVIDAAKVPDWLTGGEVRARLIVQATRLAEYDAVTIRLVAAAPEEAIAAVEAKDVSPPPVRKVKGGKAIAIRAEAKRPVIRNGGRTWTLPASEVLPRYSVFIRKVNPKLSRGEADHIARGIIGFSLRYGVDARLIVAMVMAESDFDPNCVSSTGAHGLGQLMPDTARGLGVRDRFDPMDNLYGTVKLMRGNLDRYNGATYRGLTLAIAAYNAGDGAVRRHGGIPPYRETQRYVQKVIGLYRKLCGQ